MTEVARVFYVAAVDADPPPGALGAAARNKVVGVGTAIRAAGGRPFVVTIAPGPRRTLHRHGIGFVRARAIGHRAVRRLTGSLSLAWFAWRTVARDDRVILYNAYPEVLPMAALLRLRGRPAFLDIEDAPIDGPALRDRVGRWCHRVLMPLTAPRKIVAARALADALGLAGALPVPGVAIIEPPSIRFTGDALRVHLGGSLMLETGLALFRETVALLPPDAPILFLVTGTMPDGALDGLDDRVRVTPGLSDEAYRVLRATADVGLCLKLASTQLGRTTFPSKAIEIAGAGMLLVSTSVSDVPAIFDETCAVLLRSEDPRELATALLAIAHDRPAAARIAAAGRTRVAKRFAPAPVGRAILAFIA